MVRIHGRSLSEQNRYVGRLCVPIGEWRSGTGHLLFPVPNVGQRFRKSRRHASDGIRCPEYQGFEPEIQLNIGSRQPASATADYPADGLLDLKNQSNRLLAERLEDQYRQAMIAKAELYQSSIFTLPCFHSAEVLSDLISEMQQYAE